jgi:hypothetical protein
LKPARHQLKRLSERLHASGRCLAPRLRAHARERGVAIILTLGVLSLLLVMVLAFAATALQSVTTARTGEHVVMARLLGETGLNCLFAQLSEEFADSTDPSNVFPATKSGQSNHFGLTTEGSTWGGRYYWATTSTDNAGIDSALHVGVAGVSFTPAPSVAFLDSSIGWIHQLDPSGSGAIVGRFAYLVIDESGLIDPTYAISASVAEGNENDVRVGRTTSDLDLRAAFDSDAMAEHFQPVGLGNGELPAGLPWLSRFNILRRNSVVASSTANIDEMVRTIFPHSYDIEAYHDGHIDRHRFDLVNTDWNAYNNTVTTAGVASGAAEFWAGDKVAPNTGGIPWLAYGSSPCKYAVMANLIDYCDADSIATTDSVFNPTYTGLEKTPYLNEFGFDAQVIGDGKGAFALRLGLTVELVNMFTTALGNNGKLNATVELTGSNLRNSPVTFVFNWANLGNVEATSYVAVTRQEKILYIGTNRAITDFGVRIVSARYTDAGDRLWDFSRTSASVTTTINRGTVRFITSEANDPRDNLAEDDMTWTPGGWSLLPAGTISPAAKNSVCNPNPGGDKDIEIGATEPWEVSTAYIRNGTMQTLWELGCIHRGRPWESINLTDYDENAGSRSGMDDYSDGDANILSQVKMSSDTVVYGRVNINTYSPKVVKALLTGVPLGGTYASPASTGTTVTEADAAAIAGTIASVGTGGFLYANNPILGGSTFEERGMIANVSKLYDNSVITMSTDRQREEIIGKVTNITTVRPNYFTGIIVSQVVKDFPTGYLDGILGQFDVGIDRIQAEQKFLAVIRRDGFTNGFTIERFEYWDE